MKRRTSILSYKLSNSMDSSLVTSILEDALSKYPAPLIFNSDQGSQYTGSEHIRILESHGIQISMNGKGRSIDNIIMERFETYLNKTLPILEFYKKQNILHQINGAGEINQIYKEISGIIASLET